jgi:histone-arginine methyltransferase CARM1
VCVSFSEVYWGQLDAQGARNAVNLVNGITVNGLGEVDMSSTIINTNLMAIGNQPNIHPGLISSRFVDNSLFSFG